MTTINKDKIDSIFTDYKNLQSDLTKDLENFTKLRKIVKTCNKRELVELIISKINYSDGYAIFADKNQNYNFDNFVSDSLAW